MNYLEFAVGIAAGPVFVLIGLCVLWLKVKWEERDAR